MSQVGSYLEQLCTYLASVIEHLTVKVVVKLVIPQGVLASSTLRRAKKLIALDRLHQQATGSAIDVRIVRSFRIWQKDSTLNFYLDRMQEKMRQMKRGTVERRFKFIAHHVRSLARRAFTKWALNARTVGLEQAFTPKPVLTPNSMTLWALLKLQSMVTRGR